MRNADTTLAIIQERGKRGLDLEDVYRQLYNPDLYLRAYGRIYKNAGAMTEGVTEETVDGMSQQKFENIIESLRMERYRWSPTRRTYIPKKNGKLRPLGIPTWSDKLLQEVMRSILEAYYEPQFSEHSHGFRPDRGCHTALREIFVSWNGTKWLIEGDIKGCFDNIDHTALLSILREKIHDNRFLILVTNLLKAGYLEQWDRRPTYSGTPQGGIISPLLANIYLDRLDKFVETTLIPEFNRGRVKQANPEYRKLARKIRTLTKKGATATTIASLRKEIHDHPSKDQFDPNYRRLRYIRYADDFLLGFDGPRDEAEIIKGRIGEFLRDQLKLELSPDKTLITHAGTEKARFLGYDITAARTDVRRRGVSGQMVLLVPPDVIETKVSRYTQDGEPIARPELCHDSDFSIVTRYGAEYRGIVQYYAFARNRFWFNRLHGVMWKSLFKTLGKKHKTTTRKLIGKFTSRKVSETGRIVKCVTVIIEREGKTPLVALFGGISLTPSPMTKIRDVLQDRDRIYIGHNEIMQRLLADTCELCGSRENIQVHHIRKLKDLQKPGRRPRPYYVQVMASRHRKTLVVCQVCHNAIHAGKPIVEGRSHG
jgi:group II intron reverse transcriptase/maturase